MTALPKNMKQNWKIETNKITIMPNFSRGTGNRQNISNDLCFSFIEDRAYSKDMGQPDDALELEDKRTFLDELDSEYFSSRVGDDISI